MSRLFARFTIYFRRVLKAISSDSSLSRCCGSSGWFVCPPAPTPPEQSTIRMCTPYRHVVIFWRCSCFEAVKYVKELWKSRGRADSVGSAKDAQHTHVLLRDSNYIRLSNSRQSRRHGYRWSHHSGQMCSHCPALDLFLGDQLSTFVFLSTKPITSTRLLPPSSVTVGLFSKACNQFNINYCDHHNNSLSMHSVFFFSPNYKKVTNDSWVGNL